MLHHLNVRFDGNKAFYNPVAHQIEMYLCSLQTQTVVLHSLSFQVSLAAGETIRTEISHKFHLSWSPKDFNLCRFGLIRKTGLPYYLVNADEMNITILWAETIKLTSD